MQGKIVKGISGFYYVYVVESGLYECHAKGIFRKDNMKPLVGDNVEIEVVDSEKMIGSITDILERKNTLIRPAVANIDQALVIFAAAKPKPNLNLLDRFLVSMEKQGVPCILCFNKEDVVKDAEDGANDGSNILAEYRNTYEPAGYRVIFTSAKEERGIDELKALLHGHTTTVAGPSGVGKSSIINLLQSHVEMETGAISEKIERGKHTTRHSELLPIDEDSFIMDTPGFTSLYIDQVEKEELQDYFPEIAKYEPACKFQYCSHISEPDCGVKEALEAGKIHKSRYDNYVQMYEELRDKKPVYR